MPKWLLRIGGDGSQGAGRDSWNIKLVSFPNKNMAKLLFESLNSDLGKKNVFSRKLGQIGMSSQGRKTNKPTESKPLHAT